MVQREYGSGYGSWQDWSGPFEDVQQFNNVWAHKLKSNDGHAYRGIKRTTTEQVMDIFKPRPKPPSAQ